MQPDLLRMDATSRNMSCHVATLRALADHAASPQHSVELLICYLASVMHFQIDNEGRGRRDSRIRSVEGDFAMSDVLPRVITRKELRQLVPYTPQHIHRLEKKGEFPKRIKIGKRRVGWWLHEVLAWLAERSGKSTPGIAA
jgi:prophage regulatory protein